MTSQLSTSTARMPRNLLKKKPKQSRGSLLAKLNKNC